MGYTDALHIDTSMNYRQHIIMRYRRYTALLPISTCSGMYQPYKRIKTGGNFRKRKFVNGIHIFIDAFRRKADYNYDKKNINFRINTDNGIKYCNCHKCTGNN